MTAPNPPTFNQMAGLAKHEDFRNQVRIAMVTAAIAVGAEASDPNNPETSRLRRAHSANVLQNQDAWAEQYAWAVAANPSITYPAKDNDVQFTVNSKFNAMAGAPPAAPPA